MNVRKRGLALLMCICMIFTLLPFSALADETAKVLYVDANKGNETTGDGTKDMPFATVEAAVAAANSGDTIQLAEGNYTLYGVNSDGHTKGKSLTFIGMGADKTAWNIGAEVPDPANYGTEYNGDYSFDGAGTITFKNMTLRSGSTDYLGFIRADKTVVENCTLNGKTFYWGYKSAEFNNCTFNCPTGDYAIWTYSSPVMSFDNCTFNSLGKVINVYNEGSTSNVIVNFNNCTVNSSNPDSLSVMNINDSLVESFKINFTGNNTINGIKADGIAATEGSHASLKKIGVNPDNSNKYGAKAPEDATCSKLFEFNMKYGNGNTGKTVVNIDGITVWKDGEMVSHNMDTDDGSKLYTDGYKDNAFTVEKNGNTVTKTCKYCGWKETKQDWNINVSKTATNLKKDANGDYKTNVTLSVPGVEESLATDVVFVLDKSTSAALEEKAIDLLSQLQTQVKNTGAKVKVGVVIFNKEATVTPLTDISTTEGLNTITEAIKQTISDGTNTHAGLLAGKELLDNDTGVAPNRKHLIFVSDGITYMYNKTPTAIAWGFMADTPQHFAGPDNYKSKYGDNNPPENWATWLSTVETQIGNLDPKYEYDYGKVPTDITDVSEYKNTANSIDKALYLTYKLYQEIKAEGYNCYALTAKTKHGESYTWGPSFMNMLAGGKTVSFDSIKNDILYAVGAGSYVVDKIGDDFTLDENTLRVKVGEDQYLDSIKLGADENGNWVQYFGDAATQLSENNYHFKVEYNAADKTLTWTFNENVSNFAPVQLTYTLKLTTPATNPGTYGQLDLDGDEFIDETNTPVEPLKALYTNESAVLNPIDSDDNKGLPVEFPKPSLAYTVEKPYIPPVDPGIRDKITVEITGNSDSVVYDGTEHSVKDYTVKISDSRYTEKDFTFSGKALASGINAGTYEMGLKADQFKNTNARFKNVEFIIKADGVLTITQRPLTITAGSAEGIAPVTCDKYTVEGLATGDKVDSVKLTGIQSEPGESPNVASDAVIKNAKGEDVTANYKITYVDGVLKAIEVLNKEIHFNYVIGYTDGTIRPNNDISRAEVATIFFRLLTDEAREQYTTTAGNFTDVKAGMWCNRAIATLTNMGIIKGYTDGSFQPNKSITRAELATIIARFAKLDVNTKTFSDITGHWAQKNIELAAGNGWINGYEDGTFRPNNNITRAETFAMINRVLDRQTESVSDLLPTSDMNMWSDNLNENAWYYKDVQEATNYHKCDRVGDSVYEKWTEKVPDIDWASYQI